MRSLLFQLAFYPYLFGALAFVMPFYLTSTERVHYFRSQILAKGILWLLRVIQNIHLKVKNIENIPQGPCVIAARHESVFDTVVLPFLFPEGAMVYKKELENIPLFGLLLRKSKMIAVDRQAGSAALKDLLAKGQALKEQGRPIIIFPEGTRVSPGEKQNLQPGAAALAKHLNLPLVPVGTNSGTHWPRRTFYKFPGTIFLNFGKPLLPKGTIKAINQTLAEKIHDLSFGLPTQDLPSQKRKSPFATLVAAVFGLFLLLRLGESAILFYAAQEFRDHISDKPKAVYTQKSKIKVDYVRLKPFFLFETVKFPLPKDRGESSIKKIRLKVDWLKMGISLKFEEYETKIKNAKIEADAVTGHIFFLSRCADLSAPKLFLTVQDQKKISFKNPTLSVKKPCYTLRFDKIEHSYPKLPAVFDTGAVELTLEEEGLELEILKLMTTVAHLVKVNVQGHASFKHPDDLVLSATLTAEPGHEGFLNLANQLLPLDKVIQDDPKTGRPQIALNFQGKIHHE